MRFLRKRSAWIAVLGMSVFAAQAAAVSGASACPAFANKNSADPGFDWSIQADRGDALAAVPRKIAIWGDSLTSARDFINAALEVQGISRETIAPSFIQAGMGVPGLRLPVKSACASAGWQTAYAHKEKTGRLGFSKGFLSMSSENPGEVLALDFRSPTPAARVKQLTLVYDKPKPDSSLMLGISIDGGRENYVSLSRSPGTALQIRPDTPMASIRIRLVSGKITVHGFAPVYQQTPATILDTFSVPGGLLRSWSNLGERLTPAEPAMATDYSLVLVQYGTNEGASPSFSRDNYLGYVRTNLTRMRQFYPRARCILIGPPDRGVVGAAEARALKYSLVHQQIAAAQKQAALEQRCEFWDWQAAMGGPGSALRWSRMTPPQMQGDLTHLTSKGYQLSGRLFGQALLSNKN
jgi:lysophospholipase L1-like esterase